MFNGIDFKGNPTEKTAKFEAYWSVLRELPSVAVIAACMDAQRGHVGNPDFLPTSGRLYEQAEKHVSAYRSKQRRAAEQIVHDTGPKQEFDPSATTFSCYKLGMNMAEIIAAVAAHRRGDDWRALLAARGNR